MPNRIVDLSAEPFDLLLKEPFIVATGRKDSANNVLIRVKLSDGTIGYGEVSPSPYTTGDTRETVFAAMDYLRTVVVGKDICQWRSLLAETRRSLRHQFGAHSGLEIAVLDAYTRHIGIPLYQFFGGVQTCVETDLTLSLGSPDKTRADAAKAVTEGFRKIKVKVGMSVEVDAERVIAVSEAAPGCELSLDANQAFSPKDAVELVRRVQAEGVEIALLEQPVRKDDFAGMRFVRQHTDVPVGADETVFTPEDAIRIIREDAADVINIKVAKAGLVGAMDIAAIARSANVGLMLGSMMESMIGLSASVHFICGTGGFSHCDLDPVYLLKPFKCEGGFSLDGPVFSVEGIGPGTGIRYEP